MAPNAKDGRTGRRRGHPETRLEILQAARSLFAERGFAGTSVRAVASAAGVDVALVYHYFESKDGLSRAALELPIDPTALVAHIVAHGTDEAPRRLAETFLEVWDSPETGPAMVGFLRRVLADEKSSVLVRDFVSATLLRNAAGQLLSDVDPDEARERMALVVSQMLGVVVLRKVLRVEPIASMPADRLAGALTATVARYLRGEVFDLELTEIDAIRSSDTSGSRNP
ncbi:TetR family transcriptional regulator [Nocardioides sp. DS6]|uniref:TetR family transcriptional regulator n=1 Tax=Nocardioides eburneus TaxID=3231482 RepID=A0ABV3SX29_9ACTN